MSKEDLQECLLIIREANLLKRAIKKGLGKMVTGLLEKIQEMSAEITAQSLGSAYSSSGGKKRKMADNHAIEARDRGHGRSGPGLARDTRRADNTAQERVYTRTYTADSKRSNGSPRTGEWSCATVCTRQENKADPFRSNPGHGSGPRP